MGARPAHPGQLPPLGAASGPAARGTHPDGAEQRLAEAVKAGGDSPVAGDLKAVSSRREAFQIVWKPTGSW